MVTSKLLRTKTGHCLPVVLAALLFAGCGTKTSDQSSALLQAGATADSGYYLSQMQQSANDSKTTWQLLAVQALLKEGKIAQAADLYARLPAAMTESEQQESELLGAEVMFARRDIKSSRAHLVRLLPQQLDPQQQARYWRTQIGVLSGQPSLTLLRALIAQEPLLTGPQKQKNIDATWQTLTTLPAQRIAAMTINSDENTLQGWLDLARMWSENRSDPSALMAGIQEWRQRYPHNPGAKMLPTQLAGTQRYQPVSASKIALLLPLSGQAGVFGKLIQQGFDDARLHGTPVSAPVPVPENVATNTPPASHTVPPGSDTAVGSSSVVSPAVAAVNDLTQGDAAVAPATDGAPAVAPAATASPGPQTPIAADPTVEVKVYDTATQPLMQLLAQVQQDGAGLVVGPLLKSSVEQLIAAPGSLNILALNQPEHVQNRANICYFALSPEDEARDAARHIWQQGQRQPLLLLPQSDLGDRVSLAFADEWRRLGGAQVLAQRVGSISELKAGINSGSGIALSGAPVNVPAAGPTTADGQIVPDMTLDAAPGNVDAVYIIATRDELTLIKPMITMRTGSQMRVQLYASSRSAQGGGGADYRLEMDGVQFSDIPLLAGSNPALQQQALQAAHDNFALARLYAMGFDAWTLASHFSRLRQVPGYQISGNTGMLTADPNCVVTRKLTWLKFQQGRIIPVN